jgi:hypothetical protein
MDVFGVVEEGNADFGFALIFGVVIDFGYELD